MIDGSLESDNRLEEARLEAFRLYWQMLNIARPTRDRRSRRSGSPRRGYGTYRYGERESFSGGAREASGYWRCEGNHYIRYCPELRRTYYDVLETNLTPVRPTNRHFLETNDKAHFCPLPNGAHSSRADSRMGAHSSRADSRIGNTTEPKLT
ncbi:unnamed protein product, partial [Gordionus sp. m RMFG-2023]